MNFSFRTLHVHISQTISPVNLIPRESLSIDIKQSKSLLSAEFTELRLVMSEYLLGADDEAIKKNWMVAVQHHLVALSDQLNYYLFRERKQWNSNPDSEAIRNHYVNSLVLIENLLEEAAVRFETYHATSIKIADFRLMRVRPELRHLAAELKLIFEKAGIGQELYTIVTSGLNGLLHYGMLTDAGEKYLRGFVQEIYNLRILNDKNLEHLLLKMDFNLPELHLRRLDELEQVLSEIHGLHDQEEKIIQQKQELEQPDQRPGISLLPAQASLRQEMLDYLTKKRCYVKELMAVRRRALKDKVAMEHIFRMKTELPVEQMALFIRMLQAKGVIAKKEVGEVFNFFARYFYTDKALFISARNMLKKSTEVSFSTVLKIWELLESWLDWLDELFSVRNYQRSLK